MTEELSKALFYNHLSKSNPEAVLILLNCYMKNKSQILEKLINSEIFKGNPLLHWLCTQNYWNNSNLKKYCGDGYFREYKGTKNLRTQKDEKYKSMKRLNGEIKEKYEKLIANSIESGADTTIENKEGLNILQMTAKYKNLIVMEILLKNKYINVNDQNEEGETALHIAVKENNQDKKPKKDDSDYNIEAVETLLKHGANIDIKDGLGKKPIEYVFEYEKPKIYALLKEAEENLCNPEEYIDFFVNKFLDKSEDDRALELSKALQLFLEEERFDYEAIRDDLSDEESMILSHFEDSYKAEFPILKKLLISISETLLVRDHTVF